MADANLDPLLAAAAKILPGVLGAFGSVFMLPPGTTMMARLSSLVVGSASAIYGAPALAEWLGLGAGATAFSAFAIGLFGMATAAEVHKAIQETQLGLALRDLVRKLFRLG